MDRRCLGLGERWREYRDQPERGQRFFFCCRCEAIRWGQSRSRGELQAGLTRFATNRFLLLLAREGTFHQCGTAVPRVGPPFFLCALAPSRQRGCQREQFALPCRAGFRECRGQLRFCGIERDTNAFRRGCKSPTAAQCTDQPRFCRTQAQSFDQHVGQHLTGGLVYANQSAGTPCPGLQVYCGQGRDRDKDGWPANLIDTKSELGIRIAARSSLGNAAAFPDGTQELRVQRRLANLQQALFAGHRAA